MDKKTFTGRARERRTSRSVKAVEWIARTAITAGGVGTIFAVLLIFGFLLWVVLPLLQGAEVESVGALDVQLEAAPVEVIRAAVDDAQRMAWALRANGVLQLRRLDDGSVLTERDLFDGQRPTCWAFSPDGDDCAFGFEDGTVRTGMIWFASAYLERDQVSAEAQLLDVGSSTRHADGVVSLTPEKQWRYDSLRVEISEPEQVAKSSILLIDYSLPSTGRALGYLSVDGELSIRQFFRRFNPMLDEWIEDPFDKPITYRADAQRGAPHFLRLGGQATSLFLIWRDGHAERFDVREEVLAQGETLEVVERLELTDPGRTLDHVVYMVGKTTLIVADDMGSIRAWFPTRPPGRFARDGIEMRMGHVLAGPKEGGARVSAFATSQRSRLIAAGYDDGTIRLFHVTTNQRLVDVATDGGVPVTTLALSPKEDGLLAWFPGGLQRWRVEPGHPEATLPALFWKTWYEGQYEQQYTWQAEGGSDDFEPKLSLIPLIFGTLKATLFSMLIALPIALLAALYSSEFLTPRWRSPLKSVIEMMASLPSVVLGFLAAIVLAPFVDSVLVIVLCTIMAVPLTVVLGAHLWQFLPSHIAVRLAGVPRFLVICATLPIAVLLATLLAPLVERLCFGGDIDGWLNRGGGSNAGGWVFLLAPLCIVGVTLLVERLVGPWIRTASVGWSRAQCAAADIGRFIAVLAVGLLLAWLFGSILGGRLDPRDSIVGQYQKRNAMIVGFVMGFAIVPIIYTLAEDALSSVPQQLREGSLGCGATQWQTAWRIVVPAAMSGLFSAMMVGLGRAVGETMIVLMAAGNTAIMDWNAFNGFRTLSANIATELPEAVKGSTHYRVLFLAGLVLFALTFALNTVAELVRRHFRKRFQDL